ncbi:MAG: glycosyltransferase [Planctomycetaceae bacterium]
MSEPPADPVVSVVMSVFNGGTKLPRTIDSILNQTFTNFEFLIVDDGSTDNSLKILEEYAHADSRIRIISQSNQGLTKSLNTACFAARGTFVARQDVGDSSFPERLLTQIRYFDSHPDVVAVGTRALRIGPGNEPLGLTPNRSADAVMHDLLMHGRGLVHAASSFRVSAFRKIGGYRDEFRIAQDIDLWLRLSEVGCLIETAEILFSVEFEISGISGRNHAAQDQLARLALKSLDLRRNNLSDSAVLDEVRTICDTKTASVHDPKQERCLANYFIGSQLFALRDRRTRHYLVAALDSPRVFLRAFAKLLVSLWYCRRVVTNAQILDEA